MYRGPPSPIFDVPEFPALRRVKPLPKRRRMSGADNLHSISSLAVQGASALLQQSAAAAFLQHHQHQHLSGSVPPSPGPDATPEELLAHADTLSARMALQNYYMPLLGGVQNVLAGGSASITHDGTTISSTTSTSTSTTAASVAAAALAAVAKNGHMGFADLDTVEFGVHFAAAAAAAAAAGVAMSGLGGLGMELAAMNLGGMGGGGMFGGSNGARGRDEDERRTDDDYGDRRQHGHGNTKKRKVPANSAGSPRSGEMRPASPLSHLDENATAGAVGESIGVLSDELLRERDKERERDRDRDRERERDHERERERDFDHPLSAAYPPPPYPGQLAQLAHKRGKLTAVTLAGLQHKELLKTRKRQLAAVMGALSHGDTLALDQALSAHLPFVGGFSGGGMMGRGGDSVRVRKSKRRSVRLARAMRIVMEMPERRNRHPDAVPFPAAEFSFVCPSGTAERLIATKDEVSELRKRFEEELELQAAKAAKMAVAAASGTANGNKPGARPVSSNASGGRGKRERQERDRERAEKVQQRVNAANAPGPLPQQATATSGTTHAKARPRGDQTPESVESRTGSLDPGMTAGNVGTGAGAGTTAGSTPNTPGAGKGKNKKKKRSALANASNPHHLKNYVPSRLPYSDGAGGAPHGHGQAAGGGSLWPLAMRFLSAEIPPRRRDRERTGGRGTPGQAQGRTAGKGGGAAAPPLIQLTYPGEEWICAFCEYDLFYGDDAAFRRAVRSRKKILRRRRRARERAAAAASGAAAAMAGANKGGNAASMPPPPPPSSEEYDDDGYEDEEEVEEGAYVNALSPSAEHHGGHWKTAPDKEMMVGDL